MQNFYPTELAYLSTFCTCTPQPWGVRLRDSALRDMFSHNLTYIERPLPDEALFSLFLQERRLRRAEGEQYLNLTLERAPSTRLLQRFARMGCVRTVYDYYLYMGKTARSVGNCAAVPMTPAMRGEALSFDVMVNGAAFGEDFLRRRFARRRKAYLSGEVTHFLCYHAGRVVGMCDLFLHEGVAKIEDFDVAPAYQRRGFGSAMLAQLVRRAEDRGAHTVYLITDDADTAQEMYKKSGFVQAAQKHEILFPV